MRGFANLSDESLRQTPDSFDDFSFEWLGDEDTFARLQAGTQCVQHMSEISYFFASDVDNYHIRYDLVQECKQVISNSSPSRARLGVWTPSPCLNM